MNAEVTPIGMNKSNKTKDYVITKIDTDGKIKFITTDPAMNLLYIYLDLKTDYLTKFSAKPITSNEMKTDNHIYKNIIYSQDFHLYIIYLMIIFR